MYYHKTENDNKEVTFPLTTFAIPVKSTLPAIVQPQPPIIYAPSTWQTSDGSTYSLMWVREIRDIREIKEKSSNKKQ
jgi:hypothetical protein